MTRASASRDGDAARPPATGGAEPPRRRFLRRMGLGAGALVGLTAAVGVSDADRGDDGTRPLFLRRLRPTGPVPPLAAPDAPVTVFLPGIGGTTRYWEHVVTTGPGPAVSGSLLLVDLLGFGRSPKPWTTYTVERHVAELHRVLGDLPHVTLVGHSLGARLAVAYAARHPERVERLVLVSMPWFGNAERAKDFFRAKGTSGWFWTHMVPMAIVCLLSRHLMGWAFPLIIRDVPPEVAEDLNQMTWRSSTSTMWEVIYRHDLAADVERVPAHIPFTCLHGDRDESAPLERMGELVPLHPNCEILVKAGADHQLPLRHPGWVREHLSVLPSHA